MGWLLNEDGTCSVFDDDNLYLPHSWAEAWKSLSVQDLWHTVCRGVLGVYASIRRIPTSRLFCRRILTSVAVYKQGIRGLYAVQGGICPNYPTCRQVSRGLGLSKSQPLSCVRDWDSSAAMHPNSTERMRVTYSLVTTASCRKYVVLTS